LVLPFWYRPTRVVLEKGPLNWCVVCECKPVMLAVTVCGLKYFSFLSVALLHDTNQQLSALVAIVVLLFVVFSLAAEMVM